MPFRMEKKESIMGRVLRFFKGALKNKSPLVFSETIVKSRSEFSESASKSRSEFSEMVRQKHPRVSLFVFCLIDQNLICKRVVDSSLPIGLFTIDLSVFCADSLRNRQF